MIDLKALSRSFAFRKALDSVTFAVERGDMFGLIGPNGAGKTTLIRILATVLRPGAGTAFIDGLSVTRDAEEVRRIIGYMPDHFGVYEELQVQEYLDFFACAFDIRGACCIGLDGVRCVAFTLNEADCFLGRVVA